LGPKIHITGLAKTTIHPKSNITIPNEHHRAEGNQRVSDLSSYPLPGFFFQ